jgi:lipopolysaccharide heptosyltransferase II
MEYSRILVRATNWVGDAVMSLPALHSLRKRYPQAHIAILARPWVAGLYRHEPFCDEVISYESLAGWRDLAGKFSVARTIRAKDFDCAVLFQNAFEAAAIAFLARIPERIGYGRDGRSFLLTKAVSVPKPHEIPVHQRFYYLELLKRAGMIHEYSADPFIFLSASEEAADHGRQLLAAHGLEGRVIGVSPGAAFGGAKRWLPERFAEAAIALGYQLGASVAVFGTEKERQLGDEVGDAIRTTGISVANLAGLTPLRDFIDMVAACRVFLTNDSGSMHVASALGVPTVVVYGPTDEHATGPAGNRNAILREPVECAPCHLRECPIDHRCMTRVPAERVVDAALLLLK